MSEVEKDVSAADDQRGFPVIVGDQVAYCTMSYKTARLQIGMVTRIVLVTRKWTDYYGKPMTTDYIKFLCKPEKKGGRSVWKTVDEVVRL